MTNPSPVTVEQTIEPCPFCGDMMELWLGADAVRHRDPATCIIGKHGFYNIAAWNTRAVPTFPEQPPSREPGEDEAERVARAIFDDDQNWDRLHADYRQLIIGAATRAIAALTLPEQPRPVDDKREHVMPGDPDDLRGMALQWYLSFNFGWPHSVRESNIAIESFKDGYRAALGHKDRGGE